MVSFILIYICLDYILFFKAVGFRMGDVGGSNGGGCVEDIGGAMDVCDDEEVLEMTWGRWRCLCWFI